MTASQDDSARLRQRALDLGFDLFGVAALAEIRGEICLSEKTKSKFDWGISLGLRLSDSVLEDIQDAPTPLYFHHYRQANAFLDRGALIISSFIQNLGYEALPIPASQIIDWEKQKGHLSHKKVGSLAGHGWIGRNNLLVTPEFGSRFRLVTVLTNMPLPAGKPVEFGCGECLRCVTGCPAKAIKEEPADFDHLACFEKLKDFRRKGLVSQFICGVCVKACSPLSGQPRFVVNPFQIDI